MRFVHNDCAGIRKDGLQAVFPVHTVCQPEVLVADLEQIPFLPALGQMPTIAAVRVFAVTKRRDADTLAVKAAEFLCFIQIQNIPQGIKFFLLHDVFPVRALLQVLAQPLVTDIVTLALAQGGKNGCCDMRIVRQRIRQERQILPHNGVLERDTGGCNDDRLERQPVYQPAVAVHDGSGQVSVCLADAGPGVAQCNAVFKHGVQHGVTETDLLRPLCHAMCGENGLEDVVEFDMCVFSGKFVDHDFSSYLEKFVPPYLQLAPRRWGTAQTEPGSSHSL